MKLKNEVTKLLVESFTEKITAVLKFFDAFKLETLKDDFLKDLKSEVEKHIKEIKKYD